MKRDDLVHAVRERLKRLRHARNRVFTAREALSVINRPFGEAAILPAE